MKRGFVNFDLTFRWRRDTGSERRDASLVSKQPL